MAIRDNFQRGEMVEMYSTQDANATAKASSSNNVNLWHMMYALSARCYNHALKVLAN